MVGPKEMYSDKGKVCARWALRSPLSPLSLSLSPADLINRGLARCGQMGGAGGWIGWCRLAQPPPTTTDRAVQLPMISSVMQAY